MSQDIKGRVAIVTGGNSGTGRCTCIELAKEGMKVVVVGRRAERNDEVVEAIKAAGGEAVGISCDVGQAEQVKAMVARTVETFGAVDVLINNAGVSQWESFLDMTPEHLDRIVRTNLLSVFLCTQECYRVMLEQGRGHVINVASVAAYWPEKMEFAYGVTKTAVVKLSMHLAIEFNENANRDRDPNCFFIHCLMPAGMNTNFWGEGKPRDPKKLDPELFATLIPGILKHPTRGLEDLQKLYEDTRLDLHLFEPYQQFPWLNPNLMCVGLKPEA